MHHTSIAIIKRYSEQDTSEKTEFEYLIFEKSSKFQFLDLTRNGIGASFDFSALKKFVIEYLIISEDDIKFVDHFKSNRDEHSNYTAYEFAVENVDLDVLNNRQSTYILRWYAHSKLEEMSEQWIENQKFIFQTKELFFQSSIFSNEFMASFKNLVKARDDNRLVIFAGAGVSYDSFVPLWGELIKSMKFDINEEEHNNNMQENEDEYLRIGRLYSEIHGVKEFNEKVREILNYGETKYNPLHNLILELKPLHIITTNYDNHFEQIIDEYNFKYSIIKKDSDLPYSKNASLFIKMHGDFDEKNLVLDTNHYKNYSKNFPLIESYIRSIFASKLILFVGFSFSDPNLKQIVMLLKQILKEDIQLPYLFQIPKNKDWYQNNKNKLKSNKEVKLIEYEEAPIEKYFGQISDYSDQKRLDKFRAEIGRQTYRFLKVLKEFDIITDANQLNNAYSKLEEKSKSIKKIEDQLTNSILQFGELKALPSYIIEETIPFSLNKRISNNKKADAKFDSLRPGYLGTFNENLLRFLKEKSNDKNEIAFNNKHDLRENTEEDRYNASLALLYRSGVKKIFRAKDTNSVYFEIVPTKTNDICKCPRCVANEYIYDGLLVETEFISDKYRVSLQLVSGLVKSRLFIKAYSILEEIKKDAWKSHAYILFYIALLNQKLLYHFIRPIGNQIYPEDEIEHIRTDIEKIDIENQIHELPISNKEKRLLHYIRENKILHEARRKVAHELKEISDIYQKSLDDPTTANSNFRTYNWYFLERAFYKLYSFYYHNMLFFDLYSSYFRVADDYLKGIIISYVLPITFSRRIKSLSLFFAQTFIGCGDAVKIKRIFDEYKVTKLEFDNHKENVIKLLQKFYNFLNSGFVVNDFLRRTVEPNSLFSIRLKHSLYFERSVQQKFNNFLLLFEHVELSSNQVNDIVPVVIDFLMCNPIFRNQNALRFFKSFIVRHIQSSNDKTIELVLEYILSPNIWSDSLIKDIVDAIPNENLLPKQYFLKLIRRTEKTRSFDISQESIFPFYRLLQLEEQAEFKRILDFKNESLDFLQDAFENQIWNPVDDSEVYENYKSKIIESAKLLDIEEIDQKGWPSGVILTYQHWNNMQIYLRLRHQFPDKKLTNKLYEATNYPPYKWILKPKKFGYSKFNIRWLLSFRKEIVIKACQNNKKLIEAIQKGLKDEYNELVAELYFKEILKQ